MLLAIHIKIGENGKIKNSIQNSFGKLPHLTTCSKDAAILLSLWTKALISVDT